jgi:hypothetical protein
VFQRVGCNAISTESSNVRLPRVSSRTAQATRGPLPALTNCSFAETPCTRAQAAVSFLTGRDGPAPRGFAARPERRGGWRGRIFCFPRGAPALRRRGEKILTPVIAGRRAPVRKRRSEKAAFVAAASPTVGKARRPGACGQHPLPRYGSIANPASAATSCGKSARRSASRPSNRRSSLKSPRTGRSASTSILWARARSASRSSPCRAAPSASVCETAGLRR